MGPGNVAFTPKGGCPLKLFRDGLNHTLRQPQVAFTPKGGCPLKPDSRGVVYVAARHFVGSIHPQGWVPVETTEVLVRIRGDGYEVAFTPKGGCPLKRPRLPRNPLASEPNT